MEKNTKVRPYWHIDLKWITGIILVFVLSLTFFISGLMVITKEDMAVEKMSILLAAMFSPDGLDAEADFDEVEKELETNSKGEFNPFPGLKISFTREDIDMYPPRELRIKIFKQIAAPVYREGAEGIHAIVEGDDPELQQKFSDDMGILSIINLKNHLVLKRIQLYLLITTIVLLIPFIYFSYGFGRLGNPGLVVSLASLPSALIFTIASKIMENKIASIAIVEGGSHRFKEILSSVALPVVKSFLSIYLNALKIGVGLVILCIVTKLIWRIISRIQKTRKKAPAKY
ncbi:hypothetical protein [Alkaliphilus hydrothermalis]|uniref:Cell division protein FtsX n=1 Tax=Alkaliphilus hydrothermalis TaxID=1482730 RepID=A0ABS2NQ55_9FIRM|nr:hypothetical protein [Alkaliphilus hydrothermalis]MBM7615027.1 hypothetical protein [Alkaliphilus hydrothermalis]